MKSFVLLVINCLGQWLFIGLSMYFMVKSVSDVPISLQTVGAIIAASALSTTIGILVFFIPAGLGTREMILIDTLKFMIPGLSPDILVVAVLGTRVHPDRRRVSAVVKVGYVVLRFKKTRELEEIS